MTSKQPQGKRYRVLIDIRDDESNRAWRPGQFVNEDDLPAAVIANWLKSDPPVLEKARPKEAQAVAPPKPAPPVETEEADDGRDA